MSILGDLNDTPSAVTTQILRGPSGSEIATDAFNRADRGDDTQRLFRNNYVNSLCKFQDIKKIILKLSKFLNPKPERLINFNLFDKKSSVS
jgi:hypothetical protein